MWTCILGRCSVRMSDEIPAVLTDIGGFPPPLQADNRVMPVAPLPLPSTSLSIHYSVVPSFKNLHMAAS
jgi:hypothetical protein